MLANELGRGEPNDICLISFYEGVWDLALRAYLVHAHETFPVGHDSIIAC